LLELFYRIKKNDSIQRMYLFKVGYRLLYGMQKQIKLIIWACLKTTAVMIINKLAMIKMNCVQRFLIKISNTLALKIL
jgi:hypothetical protein